MTYRLYLSDTLRDLSTASGVLRATNVTLHVETAIDLILGLLSLPLLILHFSFTSQIARLTQSFEVLYDLGTCSDISTKMDFVFLLGTEMGCEMGTELGGITSACCYLG